MTKPSSSSPDYAALARQLVAALAEPSERGKADKGLYIVATPIGNRGDITLRALATLASVDAVLCEDTRVTGGLLHAYGIKQKLIAFHDHNEGDSLAKILQQLAAGKALALVSDAGMPLIADPGFKLVRAVREAGYPVTVLPGPSAVMTALAGSGLPTDRFAFYGFVPAKAKAREEFLVEAGGWRLEAGDSCRDVSSQQDRHSLVSDGRKLGSGVSLLTHRQSPPASSLQPPTAIFFETSPRLLATLTAMAELFGDQHQAVIARELTKLYEDYQTGTLTDLLGHYTAHPPKGELVILLAPVISEAATPDLDTLLHQTLTVHTLRDAVDLVVKATGAKKKEVYQRALKISG